MKRVAEFCGFFFLVNKKSICYPKKQLPTMMVLLKVIDKGKKYRNLTLLYTLTIMEVMKKRQHISYLQVAELSFGLEKIF